jgi:hypothetical protein
MAKILYTFIVLMVLMGLHDMWGAEAATYAQCLAACRAGVTAMEAFCRMVPHPTVRALCWGVTLYAGTPSVAMCTGFCANNF